MAVNSFTIAYIKALSSKIESLERTKFKKAVFLDELNHNSKIDVKIDEYTHELCRISLKLQVVYELVFYILILVLVYISPDNSKTLILWL